MNRHDIQYSWNDPTPIPPEIWDVPLGLDCRCVTSRSEDPKLIIREISFELTQHTPTVHQRHRRTDERTDGRTTYDKK